MKKSSLFFLSIAICLHSAVPVYAATQQKTTPEPKAPVKKVAPKAAAKKNIAPVKKVVAPAKKRGSKPAVQSKKEYKKLAGSYRCWSYNVSGGGGGNCRLFAPIILKKDGTYSVSSEKGTFTVKGDVIALSKSKLRGPGKLVGGTQIRFEYDYNGWHHVITYLKESGSPTNEGSPSGKVSEVPVQIVLEYPDKDSSINSIATIELVVEGEDAKKASYKPTAIAVWDGDRRVVGSFHKATNTPRTGKKYDVYANWGAELQKVGTIDLVAAKTQVNAILKIQKYDDGGLSAPAQQTEVTQSNAPEIVVEIDLVYPERHSSLGSLNVVVLVPEGENPATALYKPMALAIWDGDRTINASFHKATNQVKTGAKYTVYADWGGEMIKSGTLDLMTVTNGPLKKTFNTTISGS
ncbi:hypothetical protein HY620_00340 [Candidatus Uhrbacteria bacterium]|nr:hypothetical protein [Candidatus Uhrbacteria bacterium]